MPVADTKIDPPKWINEIEKVEIKSKEPTGLKNRKQGINYLLGLAWLRLYPF